MTLPRLFITALSAGLFFCCAATAEDYAITLKDHEFTPKTLAVPAGQRINLTVKNEQPTAAEFESSQLGREKVVAANSQIVVILGPLKAGDYSYEDDFHDESTGTITAK